MLGKLSIGIIHGVDEVADGPYDIVLSRRLSPSKLLDT